MPLINPSIFACLLYLLCLFLTTRAQETPGPKGICPYAKYTAAGYVHTACLPPNASCQIFSQGVSQSDQILILKLQNQIRNAVANGQQAGANGQLLPMARNMRELRWNPELAYIAQAHTNQCNLAYECYSCRGTSDYAGTSESVFYINNYVQPQKQDWTAAINFWAKFSSSLSSVKAKSYSFTTFTQMISAQSRDVGCGYTSFSAGNNGPKVTELFTCLYGPFEYSGDVYEVGATCSDCSYRNTCCGSACASAGVTADYSGLCELTTPS